MTNDLKSAEDLKDHEKIPIKVSNQDKIKARTNASYYENIEAIKEYNNKPCICECGGKYTNSNKIQHLKSIKHKKYIDSQV